MDSLLLLTWSRTMKVQIRIEVLPIELLDALGMVGPNIRSHRRADGNNPR